MNLSQEKSLVDYSTNNNTNNIIKNELIEYALQSFHIIMNNNMKLMSMTSFQYIFFLSLVLVEIIDKFNLKELVTKINFKKNEKEYDFNKILRKIRAILKQYTEENKYCEIKKIIEKTIENNYNWMLEGYDKEQLELIERYGQKDFCVYSYEGIPYFNNNQIKIFFSDFNNGNNIDGEAILEFMARTTRFLKDFLSNFTGIIDVKKIKNEYNKITNEDIIGFDMNDYFVYEKNRKDLFVNDLESHQNVFLFNLLCMANTIHVIYPEIFNIKGHILLRMKIIVYFTIVKGLWIYDKKYKDLPTPLKEIIKESNSVFKTEEDRGKFRNNIFHFDLPEGIIYEENSINVLIKYYTELGVEDFEKLIEKSYETFKKETNILLFKKNRMFFGTNA